MKALPAEHYDEGYRKDRDGARQYHRRAKESPAWPLIFEPAVDLLRSVPFESVLELGCGTGQFAFHVSTVWGVMASFLGVDFSEVALEEARYRLPGSFFLRADLDRWPDVVAAAHADVVVALEVLEHIERDLDVLASVAPGVHVILSVPSFMTAGHVRCFESADAVRERYGHLIEFLVTRETVSRETGNRWFIALGRRK